VTSNKLIRLIGYLPWEKASCDPVSNGLSHGKPPFTEEKLFFNVLKDT